MTRERATSIRPCNDHKWRRRWCWQLHRAHPTLTAPFGAGYRSDHIDLLRAAGDLTAGFLVTGAVNFVCSQREKGGADYPGITVFEAHKGMVGKDDPVGAHLEKSR